MRGRRTGGRSRGVARRVTTRSGYHCCKLSLTQDTINSTGGLVTAAVSQIQPIAGSQQLTEWCARLDDYLGSAALIQVWKQFRIRGFELTFTPNWSNVDIANVVGLSSQTAAFVPMFRYAVNRDPAALPDAATTSSGTALSEKLGNHTHNFTNGRPLRVYCKWPKIPEYIPRANFEQGEEEGDQWQNVSGTPIYAAGRARWLPTSQSQAITAEHLGILTAFDEQWLPGAGAFQPQINVTGHLWVEFKDFSPGYLATAP